MVTIGSRYSPSAREIVSPAPAISKASVSDMGFPSGSTWYSVPSPLFVGTGFLGSGGVSVEDGWVDVEGLEVVEVGTSETGGLVEAGAGVGEDSDGFSSAKRESNQAAGKEGYRSECKIVQQREKYVDTWYIFIFYC